MRAETEFVERGRNPPETSRRKRKGGSSEGECDYKQRMSEKFSFSRLPNTEADR